MGFIKGASVAPLLFSSTGALHPLPAEFRSQNFPLLLSDFSSIRSWTGLSPRAFFPVSLDYFEQIIIHGYDVLVYGLVCSLCSLNRCIRGVVREETMIIACNVHGPASAASFLQPGEWRWRWTLRAEYLEFLVWIDWIRST
jgi:hypothetical protein